MSPVPELHVRESLAQARDRRGEGGLIDHRLGVGVLEEILEFLVDVAVIDIERRGPGLEGAEHPFEILVAVVEIEPDVVLARLPAKEPPAIRTLTEMVAAQYVGQSPGAVGDLRPAEATVAEEEALAIGNGGGDGLVYGRQIQHRLVRRVIAWQSRAARTAGLRPASAAGYRAAKPRCSHGRPSACLECLGSYS